MRCRPLVTVLVLLLPVSGRGHKDLAGQVYPIVQATTDGFDVYFTNNVMRPFTRSTHPDCLEIDDPRDFRFRKGALFRERVSRAGVRTKPERVCARHQDHSPEASAAWMERLQAPVQSNTSLSAAVNGDELLIAWHEPGDEGEGAVIKVVHHGSSPCRGGT